ncbi:imelysin family protein [Salinarimonas sp.]|uniref:imelysin family protein n=1 Tax=Salinarimonas sp. TaxID=2766526 RepID=UPI0032D95600
MTFLALPPSPARITRAVALGALLALAAPAAAQPLDPQAAAIRAAETVLVPGYAGLAVAAADQRAAWNEACEAPAPRDLAPLDEAFHAVADAWAGVEAVRTGPIADAFRFERMAFWPERRNAAARALAQLEGLDDEALLAPDRFVETSVAGQGLTALERLLFEEDSRTALAEGGDRQERLCAIGEAITAALARVTDEVAQAWRAETLPEWRSDADAARRAASRLVTDLLTGLQAVEDLKLGLPLGESLDDARATRAEMWRAGRSARQIALNLAGLEALVVALAGDAETVAQDTLRALAQAQRLAREGPSDIGEAAADSDRRSRVLLLQGAVATARSAAAAEIPPALGVVTGFNALDGD